MLRILKTRPPSVWLAQILLLGGAFLLLMWPFTVFLVLPQKGAFFLGEYVGQNDILAWSLKALAYLSPFIVVPLIAFVGLAKRKRWGRWLSVAVFACAFPCSALLMLMMMEGHRYHGYSSAETVRLIFFIVLSGVCILLIARLSFGEAEKKFFATTIRK